ncbi:glycosyltransferase family 2 protein [Pontibacter pudoricolor]|uniref:glycosyltransferase family 2 protein n=1 Tax=Pontibacter pudoricolor TaxID=2694930 RepID=UPI001390F978|nr:glycosyltransferase [Pontibacter pudoricolor]
MIPKVSIIVPVFNSELYLYNSLDCLLKQTYKDIEIIIIDDSSTDNSYTVAKQFESNNVKVIKQPNAGAAVARNTGLSYAAGEYIQFMDADDYLSVDKIEKQVAALKGSYDKVAVCNYINFFAESDLSHSTYEHDQDTFIFSTNDPVNFLLNLYGANGQSNFIQTNSWLVPRPLIDKAGGWRNYRCPDDDGEFFSRILLASGGVVYVPNVYNYYRRSIKGDALSQRKDFLYLRNTLLTIDLKRTYLGRYTSGTNLKKAIAKQYLDFAVSTYLNNHILSDIAYKRFRSYNIDVQTPKIGGTTIEIIKILFGWKVAKRIKFILKSII